MKKITAYLDDVIKEMRKVNWPSQKEVMSNTGITLVATVIISLFVYGVDQIISTVLEFIYR